MKVFTFHEDNLFWKRGKSFVTVAITQMKNIKQFTHRKEANFSFGKNFLKIACQSV